MIKMMFTTAVVAAVVMLSAPVMFAQPNTRAISDTLRGQPKPPADSISAWKIGGLIGTSFSQVALKNWTGGGKNTVAVLGLFAGAANYAGGEYFWDNSLELGYGITKLGDDPFRKSDDRIILTSKAARSASDVFRYTALVDFRTQFTVGRNFDAPDSVTGEFPITSNFMAPAVVIGALGIEYKPVEYFSVLLSPLTGRATLVLDEELSNQGAFGVTPGDRAFVDIGSFLNALLKADIVENVMLQSRLNLFSRYKDPSKVVVTWENLVTMKINAFLNASVATDVIYDERVVTLRDDGSTGPATQIRNALAIGLSYGF